MDAQAGFEAALAEAKKSGRRLWVRVAQTRTNSCFRFSFWLNEHKDVLAKDYVMFKFDNIRDLHGQELRKTLKLDRKGIPCHAIYDGDGKELINSVGPQGNIGCPVSDPKYSIDPVTTRHFRKMLETTAQKITAAEIDELIRSLDRE
ncbi:MAG: thioredoxin family protein, partial [Planctomycetaceae bacterium]